MRKKVVIMGAGGRDFHNFNVVYRDNEEYEVVAFTATQIPYQENRVYPPELAGKLYPEGIPIVSEDELPTLIKKHGVDEVVFAYSDVSHTYVMNRASLVNSLGATFKLLGPKETYLESAKPVIAVTAIRTGSGKSPVSRYVSKLLDKLGYKVGIIRHPMAYGDLLLRRAMKLKNIEDLDKYDLTIEEKEDIEPHIINGFPVYIGVDYQEVLKMAEEETDIILWDGGNNDYPFIKPDIHIVVIDPYRWRHIDTYYPGEINVRMADIGVISKVNTADRKDVEDAMRKALEINPSIEIVEAGIKYVPEKKVDLKGRNVVVIEDGPTTTHGEMGFGAAYLYARDNGANIIDPKPYAVGSYRDVYRKYRHLKEVIPALGYSREQMMELTRFLNNIPEVDLILSASPTKLSRYLKIDKEIIQIYYELDDIDNRLERILKRRLEEVITIK